MSWKRIWRTRGGNVFFGMRTHGNSSLKREILVFWFVFVPFLQLQDLKNAWLDNAWMNKRTIMTSAFHWMEFFWFRSSSSRKRTQTYGGQCTVPPDRTLCRRFWPFDHGHLVRRSTSFHFVVCPCNTHPLRPCQWWRTPKLWRLRWQQALPKLSLHEQHDSCPQDTGQILFVRMRCHGWRNDDDGQGFG